MVPRRILLFGRTLCEAWRASECLRNETWRWGILAVLLILVALFGGRA